MLELVGHDNGRHTDLLCSDRCRSICSCIEILFALGEISCIMTLSDKKATIFFEVFHVSTSKALVPFLGLLLVLVSKRSIRRTSLLVRRV